MRFQLSLCSIWGYLAPSLPLLQVINAANEVVDSIDREELAKKLSVKTDPEDDEAEVRSSLSNCFIEKNPATHWEIN